MKTSFKGTFAVGDVFALFLYDTYDEGVITVNTHSYLGGLLLSTDHAPAAARMRYKLEVCEVVGDVEPLESTFRMMKSKHHADEWRAQVCPTGYAPILNKEYHYILTLSVPTVCK